MVPIDVAREDVPGLAWKFEVPSQLADAAQELCSACENEPTFQDANEPAELAAAYLAVAFNALDAGGAAEVGLPCTNRELHAAFCSGIPSLRRVRACLSWCVWRS